MWKRVSKSSVARAFRGALLAPFVCPFCPFCPASNYLSTAPWWASACIPVMPAAWPAHTDTLRPSSACVNPHRRRKYIRRPSTYRHARIYLLAETNPRTIKQCVCVCVGGGRYSEILQFLQYKNGVPHSANRQVHVLE